MTNPLRFPFRAHDPESPPVRACVSLTSALYCIDCDHVSEADAGQTCAHCGSTATRWLSAWLNRRAG